MKQQVVEAEGGDAKKHWQEVVEDLLTKRLHHLGGVDGGFVYDPQTGRYGFQEGSEYDSDEEQTDNYMKEDYIPKGDADESFITIPEDQQLSLELSRKKEGPEHPVNEGTSFHSAEMVYGTLTTSRNTTYINRRADRWPHERGLHPKNKIFKVVQLHSLSSYVPLEQSAKDCTPDHVGQFLKEIGLGHHTATFIEEKIDADMLLEAGQKMLKDLGVVSAVEQLKIKVHVRG